MQTDAFERALRSALRETLDLERGPDPAWVGSPAARRVAQPERRRWPLRALAVAAVIGAVGGAALLAGSPEPMPNQTGPAANGWVAFTVDDDAAGGDPDVDIWFTGLGLQPRRAVGTDTDGLDQVCPAFSPDGRSLAYASIEDIRTAGGPSSNSALVIADVADDGAVTERMTIDVGDGVPPPCAIWSPTSDRLAFGVPLTSPVNPLRYGDGSEVWILRLADRHITIVPDLLASDLEWSPDGSTLAIVGGGLRLEEARIHLYELAAGTLRTLDETLGATALTWSPDGERIAFAGLGSEPALFTTFYSGRGLWVIEVGSGQPHLLTDNYRAMHGIGPVWSPNGETIAYQRRSDAICCEKHEVVLLTVGDRTEQAVPATEVVLRQEVTTSDGSGLVWPWRVTWSPDGAYLMDVAWTDWNDGVEKTVIVAIPTDPDAPAVVLADMDGIGAYDFADGAMRVSFQIWQRRPAGPAQ